MVATAKNDRPRMNYAFLAPAIAQIPRRRQVPTSYLKRNMQHLTTFKPVFASLTLLASLQLTSAQTIPPSLAAPPGSVNTNVPGFKMRIVQGNSSTPQTAAAPAEALISGKIIDPATGLPLNLATPNPVDGSFIYNIDRYINLHEQ